MTLEHGDPRRVGLSTWSQHDLANYARVAPWLPVTEESITQTGGGELHADVALTSADDVAIFRPRINVRSIGVTVLEPAYIGFAMPIAWNGEYVINGEAATPSTIYLPVDTSSFHIRGDERDTLGVILRRDHFNETLAALLGVDPDKAVMDRNKLILTPAAAGLLCSRLSAILDQEIANPAACAPPRFADEVFGLMADACLSAMPMVEPAANAFRITTRIVRQAEERFAEAEGERLSLADLCAAAGVGKSTLYKAFQTMCGQPPLDYFHKRRLTRARSILLDSPPQRGMVKCAALTVGLTDLGRFSVDYRRLFGESPSATLKRSPN